jgi:hypothetical protein
MPIYRISRHVISDAIDVEASSPEEAVLILEKAGVEAKTEFLKTVIEEQIAPSKPGYREETGVDVIGARVTK